MLRLSSIWFVRRSPTALAVLVVSAASICGCASYTTPGGPAHMIKLADGDIAERFSRKPAAQFPARLAVVRIQAPEYRAYKAITHGSGNYTVCYTRDAETEEQFKRIAAMSQVAGVAPLNRLLLPESLESDRELRLAAASVRADILIVYTVDTVFRLDETALSPLQPFLLGHGPFARAEVTATASAALYDVRTGFVHGLAEATASESKVASAWTSTDAVEDTRIAAERAAIGKLVGEIEASWRGIVGEHAGG